MSNLIRFDSINLLKEHGFTGFATVEELQETKCKGVSENPGVYIVVRSKTTFPTFLGESIGGHFKGRNPTVTNEKLKDKWVEASIILYIGKAGSLRDRLKQYMDFGRGKRVGHHGGRYIWQLENSGSLQIFWKPTPNLDPALEETELIQTFYHHYGRLPFANLRF